MPEPTGTASAASSPANQGPAGGTTDWHAESARLQAELNSRDNQIRALSQIKQSWERNVGKELEGVIEYDQNGLPMRVNYGDQGGRPAYTGANPLVAGGVDAATAQQHDEYLRGQFGQSFVTPAQLQAQVNAAADRVYLAATTRFETVRNVERTLADPLFKSLGDFTSPLAKKTEEVLARNGWGTRPPTARSWEDGQFAAPTAFSIAAQIANAELFAGSQQAQTSEAAAQAAQAAASIAAGGGGSAAPGAPSTDEMVRMFRDDPVKAEALAKQQFQQAVGRT